MDNTELLSLGLMSGTSMDGIDAALIRTDGRGLIEEIGSASLHYASPFHHALKLAEYSVRRAEGNIEQAQKDYAENAYPYFSQTLELPTQKIAEILLSISNYFNLSPSKLPSFSQVIDHSTDLHAQICHELMETVNLKPDIIGYHGQNLYHAPQDKLTLQVGNAQSLANQTKTVVVNNFRTNDVLHGGQGAPLAPLYHQALGINHNLLPLAIVNCGGVANVSFVFGPAVDQVMGFDTGPGNGLIDLFVKQRTNGLESYDRNGQYGKRGQIDQTCLDLLHQSLRPYLNTPPPKSLDISDFSLVPELDNLSLEDGCRTLEAFTARTIVSSLDHLKGNTSVPELWVLAGGGWHNPVIFEEFSKCLHKRHLKCKIKHADQLNLNSQAIEAQIFAYLAVRSLKDLPLSMPLTTGVKEPLSGGVVTHPSSNGINLLSR